MLGDMADPDHTAPASNGRHRPELQSLLQRIVDLAPYTEKDAACPPTTIHTSSGIATVIWFRRRREPRDARFIHPSDGGDEDG